MDDVRVVESPPQEDQVAPAAESRPAPCAAKPRKFSLIVRDLPLKQAPMEAVVNRET